MSMSITPSLAKLSVVLSHFTPGTAFISQKHVDIKQQFETQINIIRSTAFDDRETQLDLMLRLKSSLSSGWISDVKWTNMENMKKELGMSNVQLSQRYAWN